MGCRGDRDAFDCFFERNAARVLVYINRNLGDQSRRKVDPSDILQNFYLALFKNFTTLSRRREGVSKWFSAVPKSITVTRHSSSRRLRFSASSWNRFRTWVRSARKLRPQPIHRVALAEWLVIGEVRRAIPSSLILKDVRQKILRDFSRPEGRS